MRFGLFMMLVPASAAMSADVPAPTREFRAAWIATVANIDWPSRPGLPAAQQQRELVELLDLANELRLNAVVFQVRPACDAMYDSPLEPWSEFLTGKQGVPPDPDYDPLQFAVEQAHARGLELHAWFNPYRASHPSGKSDAASSHVSNRHPEWVREYGPYQWLDPGEPAAAEYSRRVIVDVVRRYDIDAVHLDDYFYPYPVTDDQGRQVPFPDDASWEKYTQQTDEGERLSRDDWRRRNVDQFLARLAQDIQREKPWVRFGVSPFGIYRPGQPESIRGFDAYAGLYADARKWLAEGVVDYLAPQLYWPIEQEPQSFPVLLDWWIGQNEANRHVWPGLFTSQLGAEGRGWPVTQIERQIKIARDQLTAPGHIHFSIKPLAQNRSGIADHLRDTVYREVAIPPATPWRQLPPGEELDGLSPGLEVHEDAHAMKLEFSLPNNARPWLWVVQWQTAGDWKTKVIAGQQRSARIDGEPRGVQQIAIRAVDRLGNLSKPTTISGWRAAQ